MAKRLSIPQSKLSGSGQGGGRNSPALDGPSKLDEHLLEHKRLDSVRAEALRKARREEKLNQKGTMMRWFQFGVVLWAIRLGVQGIGIGVGGLPVLVNCVFKFVGLQSLVFYDPSDTKISQDWKFTDAVDQKKFGFSKILQLHEPFLMKKTPCAST